ncbi:Ktr system potassium uptake protein A [uncultured Roseburia sp.]|uniref:TrkA family potassium uptake protein n=1 Tax=Brotonthovivens ammoniilytica TaxID=2981725 RepID=A0ABT2TJI9_9FIRM|nr:TrkA family potassium uptake protein [Brotonthovivens ammoniilytica]MCU6762373.1 TrkA family potassium uptake protein [Brotonthovivens ammoniilytica]SCI69678.1 Ktr system potassium uptake protein A [uncultured Roseburia sp.]
MKSILIIGLGRFGSYLCQKFAELGNEVMIVDQDEELLEPLLPFVTSAKIGDCTKESVLRSLGVGNFDVCFVCIGTNFQSSLEITSQLKELGAKKVISKATRKIQAKFLLRNGADSIVYPERDIAEKCAVQYSSDNIFDYFELGNDFAIYEITPMQEWIGKSIMNLDFRNKYHVNIVAIKTKDGLRTMPTGDYTFQGNEHLMVIGHDRDLEKIINKIN